MRLDVVALFVDKGGPYPKLLADWYDERRDGRTYAGELPVVAHPPCGAWSRSARHLYSRDDAELALFAAETVRRVGGVLEHPADSLLFELLPKPGKRDRWGSSLEVEQVRWGHPARKRTWLYLCGVKCALEVPPPREPTHWCSGRRGMANPYDNVPPGIKVCSAEQRRRTPPAFAEWLINLAASVRS